MSRLLVLWRPGRFATSYLPVVLRSRMTGLIGMFQKVYSLAVQSFRMRKNEFSTGLRPGLGKLYFVTYRLLGTGVCLLKSALCARRFHDRKKTGSDMISPATRQLRLRSVFRCIHWFGRETNGLALPALSSGCFLVSSPGNPCWKRSMDFWLRLLY